MDDVLVEEESFTTSQHTDSLSDTALDQDTVCRKPARMPTMDDTSQHAVSLSGTVLEQDTVCRKPERLPTMRDVLLDA